MRFQGLGAGLTTLLNRVAPAHRFVFVEQAKPPERDEVYERIPWEMLEPKRNDRQWLVLGIAGAVVLGVLAYAIVSERTTAQQPVQVAVTTAPAPPPATAAASPPIAVPGPSSPPVVTAEADLYAVDPERVLDRVAAHAEWFVAEYLTVDGSEQSRQVLAGLLPGDVPLPEPAEGVRVFVEWVRAFSVEELEPLRYRVEVLARTLTATGEEPYSRRPPVKATVVVTYTGETPAVALPPRLEEVLPAAQAQLDLVAVPAGTAEAALDRIGSGQVVGGIQRQDGSWEVVVVAPSPDGVIRPQTVPVP